MLIIASISLAGWVWLIVGHGRFWQSGPVLPSAEPDVAVPVTVVAPARDEAASVERRLRSLPAQSYAGPWRVVLVDDGSTEGTGKMMMSASFVPTLRRFGQSVARAPFLPLTAPFYTAATVGSAADHMRGRGVVWKRRSYS